MAKHYTPGSKEFELAETTKRNDERFEAYARELAGVVEKDLAAKGIALDETRQGAVFKATKAYHDSALSQGAEAQSLNAMYKELEAAGFSAPELLQVRGAVMNAPHELETEKLAAELGKGGRILLIDPSRKRHVVEDDSGFSDKVQDMMGKPLPDSIAKATNAAEVHDEARETLHKRLKGMPERVVDAAEAYLAYRFQEMQPKKAATAFAVASLDMKLEDMPAVMKVVDAAVEQHLGAQSHSFAAAVNLDGLKKEFAKKTPQI